MNDLQLPDERFLSPARFAATQRELRRLPRRRRSRWATSLALAGALVLLSAAAAVGYGLIRPQERFESQGCYDQPSLEGSVAVISTSERDPAEACRELWADGVVGAADAPVPDDLTACVTGNGRAVAVFPAGAGICDRLGLQALDDVEVEPGEISVPRLSDALAEQFPLFEESGTCIDGREGRRRAQHVLDDLGARGWKVTWQGDDADGRVSCAGIFEIDGARRQLALYAETGPEAPSRRIGQLLRAHGCIGDPQAAREAVEQALVELGLRGWRIEVAHDVWEGHDPELIEEVGGRECASFDIEDRTVYVGSVIHELGWRRHLPWN